MVLENDNQTSWCCYFTNNPIGTRSGQNTLMLKPAIQTLCLFGFDPEENCAQCITDHMYIVPIFQFASGTTIINGRITISLSGVLCTQITGR